MTLVFTLNPSELDVIVSALARLHNTELRKLRAMQKRQSKNVAGQAMWLAEIKMLHTRATAQRDEIATIINKETKNA